MSDDKDPRMAQRREGIDRRSVPRVRITDGAILERRQGRRRRYICMRQGSPFKRPLTIRKPLAGLGSRPITFRKPLAGLGSRPITFRKPLAGLGSLP